MRTLTVLLLLIVPALISGCAQVQVKPELESSLGYEAFASMHVLKKRNMSVGIYISPKLLEAKATETIKMGDFSFDIGKSLAVKIIKAVSYQFNEIYILKNFTDRAGLHACMRFDLQDIDSKMSVHHGFGSVSTENFTRLAIRADLIDVTSNRIIWVGTTQVNETSEMNEKILTYQEAGRGFAQGFNAAIDKAVGDILYQMSRSQNLSAYFASFEKK